MLNTGKTPVNIHLRSDLALNLYHRSPAPDCSVSAQHSGETAGEARPPSRRTSGIRNRASSTLARIAGARTARAVSPRIARKGTIAQMLGMGLARQGAVRRREDVEIAMEESMMEIIPQLEKRTPYVALLSNIATLLGLLGTIMGLIQAFTAVANANPAEKADLLSASISVAMNTTAFGLMSAIPLLLFHAKITSTTGQIIDSLEMASVKALNSISISHRQKSVQNDSNIKENNEKK